MPKSRTVSPTGADTTAEWLTVHGDVKDRIERYAIENLLPVSEVIRMAMRVYTLRRPTARQRATERVSFRVDPEEYAHFRAAVQEDGTTRGAAIEVALGLLP